MAELTYDASKINIFLTKETLLANVRLFEHEHCGRQEVVCRNFLGLDVIYVLPCFSEEYQYCLTYKDLNNYNVSVYELYSHALENCEKEFNISDTIAENDSNGMSFIEKLFSSSGLSIQVDKGQFQNPMFRSMELNSIVPLMNEINLSKIQKALTTDSFYVMLTNGPVFLFQDVKDKKIQSIQDFRQAFDSYCPKNTKNKSYFYYDASEKIFLRIRK